MSKFKDNIPGFPGYHVTKNGDVYSMKCKSGKRPEAFKQRPRRAIFSKKGGRRKAQYYEKRHVEYYCNICGKKRYENNKPV
jgi:hypothetical protein